MAPILSGVKLTHLGWASSRGEEGGENCWGFHQLINIIYNQGEGELLNLIFKLMQKSYVDYPGLRMESLAFFLGRNLVLMNYMEN
jgi:hypothetical protein